MLLGTVKKGITPAHPTGTTKLRCSACGSSAPHHLTYVIRTGKCVV